VTLKRENSMINMEKKELMAKAALVECQTSLKCLEEWVAAEAKNQVALRKESQFFIK
jgi:hypothetical protein